MMGEHKHPALRGNSLFAAFSHLSLRGVFFRRLMRAHFPGIAAAPLLAALLLFLAAAPAWARVRVLLYYAHPNMYFTRAAR